MPVISCTHCSDEFNSVWQCEEHEKHCVHNPATTEHAVAERMKHYGMDYQASMTAYENEQRLLKAWLKNVNPVEAELNLSKKQE